MSAATEVINMRPVKQKGIIDNVARLLLDAPIQLNSGLDRLSNNLRREIRKCCGTLLRTRQVAHIASIRAILVQALHRQTLLCKLRFYALAYQ